MRVLRKTLPGTGASARAESREGEEAGRERGRAKTRSRVLGALAAAACAGLLLSAFNATETQAQETWDRRPRQKPAGAPRRMDKPRRLDPRLGRRSLRHRSVVRRRPDRLVRTGDRNPHRRHPVGERGPLSGQQDPRGYRERECRAVSRKTFILVAGLALLAGCNKYEENVVDVREDLVAIDERFDELTDPARRDVDAATATSASRTTSGSGLKSARAPRAISFRANWRASAPSSSTAPRRRPSRPWSPSSPNRRA